MAAPIIAFSSVQANVKLRTVNDVVNLAIITVTSGGGESPQAAYLTGVRLTGVDVDIANNTVNSVDNPTIIVFEPIGAVSANGPNVYHVQLTGAGLVGSSSGWLPKNGLHTLSATSSSPVSFTTVTNAATQPAISTEGASNALLVVMTSNGTSGTTGSGSTIASGGTIALYPSVTGERTAGQGWNVVTIVVTGGAPYPASFSASGDQYVVRIRETAANGTDADYMAVDNLTSSYPATWVTAGGVDTYTTRVAVRTATATSDSQHELRITVQDFNGDTSTTTLNVFFLSYPVLQATPAGGDLVYDSNGSGNLLRSFEESANNIVVFTSISSVRAGGVVSLAPAAESGFVYSTGNLSVVPSAARSTTVALRLVLASITSIAEHGLSSSITTVNVLGTPTYAAPVTSLAVYHHVAMNVVWYYGQRFLTAAGVSFSGSYADSSLAITAFGDSNSSNAFGNTSADVVGWYHSLHNHNAVFAASENRVIGWARITGGALVNYESGAQTQTWFIGTPAGATTTAIFQARAFTAAGVLVAQNNVLNNANVSYFIMEWYLPTDASPSRAPRAANVGITDVNASNMFRYVSVEFLQDPVLTRAYQSANEVSSGGINGYHYTGSAVLVATVSLSNALSNDPVSASGYSSSAAKATVSGARFSVATLNDSTTSAFIHVLGSVAASSTTTRRLASATSQTLTYTENGIAFAAIAPEVNVFVFTTFGVSLTTFQAHNHPAVSPSAGVLTNPAHVDNTTYVVNFVGGLALKTFGVVSANSTYVLVAGDGAAGSSALRANVNPANVSSVTFQFSRGAGTFPASELATHTITSSAITYNVDSGAYVAGGTLNVYSDLGAEFATTYVQYQDQAGASLLTANVTSIISYAASWRGGYLADSDYVRLTLIAAINDGFVVAQRTASPYNLVATTLPSQPQRFPSIILRALDGNGSTADAATARDVTTWKPQREVFNSSALSLVISTTLISWDIPMTSTGGHGSIGYGTVMNRRGVPTFSVRLLNNAVPAVEEGVNLLGTVFAASVFTPALIDNGVAANQESSVRITLNTVGMTDAQVLEASLRVGGRSYALRVGWPSAQTAHNTAGGSYAITGWDETLVTDGPASTLSFFTNVVINYTVNGAELPDPDPALFASTRILTNVLSTAGNLNTSSVPPYLKYTSQAVDDFTRVLDGSIQIRAMHPTSNFSVYAVPVSDHGTAMHAAITSAALTLASGDLAQSMLHWEYTGSAGSSGILPKSAFTYSTGETGSTYTLAARLVIDSAALDGQLIALVLVDTGNAYTCTAGARNGSVIQRAALKRADRVVALDIDHVNSNSWPDCITLSIASVTVSRRGTGGTEYTYNAGATELNGLLLDGELTATYGPTGGTVTANVMTFAGRTVSQINAFMVRLPERFILAPGSTFSASRTAASGHYNAGAITFADSTSSSDTQFLVGYTLAITNKVSPDFTDDDALVACTLQKTLRRAPALMGITGTSFAGGANYNTLHVVPVGLHLRRVVSDDLVMMHDVVLQSFSWTVAGGTDPVTVYGFTSPILSVDLDGFTAVKPVPAYVG